MLLDELKEGECGQQRVTACLMLRANSDHLQGVGHVVESASEVVVPHLHQVLNVVDTGKPQRHQPEKFLKDSHLVETKPTTRSIANFEHRTKKQKTKQTELWKRLEEMKRYLVRRMANLYPSYSATDRQSRNLHGRPST